MMLLCTLFAIGVAVIFIAAIMVAVAAMGICVRTIGAMGITVAVIVILSCWLCNLYQRIGKKS